jgi:hypothetical protein
VASNRRQGGEKETLANAIKFRAEEQVFGKGAFCIDATVRHSLDVLQEKRETFSFSPTYTKQTLTHNAPGFKTAGARSYVTSEMLLCKSYRQIEARVLARVIRYCPITVQALQ